MNLTKLSTFIILSMVVLSCFVGLYRVEPTAAISGGDFAFHATRLAAGTNWTINLVGTSGANRTSTNNPISFTNCNGFYSWTIYVPAGYRSNSSLTGSYLMDMRETYAVYVTFIPLSVNYTLTMETVGQGSVYPGNQTYTSGTNVNLTAVPDEGWAFSGWSGDTSGVANTTVVMNTNKTITATFTQTTIIETKTTDNQTYIITINSNTTTSQTSNMTITPHASNSATIVAFTITGESGTVGSFNLTIPKAAIPYGSAPVLYIEGVKAENQTNTEDAENYYISYIMHFSTHEVEIAFSTEADSSSNSSASSSTTSTTHTSPTATPTPIVTPTPQPTTNPTATPTATPTAVDLNIWGYLVILIIAFAVFFAVAWLGYRHIKRY
ncbi:MAG TPA: hypothetical protein VLH35_01465 [Candidatus Acidoferrales bacterium]|nr:hypothetical protein [Candidatus Acidoferrales bacterium]